ncbi:MAG: hypothetical protein IIZ43_00580, partial [Eubacterium sp.]|nr:hypothetical protein [Eubacterium sp.]
MMQFKRVKTALPRKAGRIRTGVTMTTRWGNAVRGAAAADAAYQPLTEYPRPQMVRQEPAGSWNNLNGWWEYAITQEDLRPEQWDGRILVPFSPEAPLSGVERQLTPKEYLWYRRTITVCDPEEGRWLLHFGAVDQQCIVYVNGKKAGRHSGGYLPFSAEVTDVLRPGENELTLCVRDVSETSYLTRGKQKIARGGMFYTAQSGIWQTVWLERVPKRYIREVKITPKEDAFELAVLVDGGTAGDEASVTAEVFAPRSSAETACDAGWFCEGDPVSEADGRIPEWNKRGEGRLKLTIPVPDCRRWSPEDPALCGIRVQAGDDSVCLYSALRELSLAKDEEGRIRLCLNGKPCFMNGVLDQGYWPESLLTAPDDRALIHDIAEM